MKSLLLFDLYMNGLFCRGKKREKEWMHGRILCAHGLSGSYEAVHGEEASPTHASYKPERASQVALVVKNLLLTQET